MKIQKIKQQVIILDVTKQQQLKGGTTDTSTANDSIISGDIDAF